MLLYIESCRAGSLFDGILSEYNNSKHTYSKKYCSSNCNNLIIVIFHQISICCNCSWTKGKFMVNILHWWRWNTRCLLGWWIQLCMDWRSSKCNFYFNTWDDPITLIFHELFLWSSVYYIHHMWMNWLKKEPFSIILITSELQLN